LDIQVHPNVSTLFKISMISMVGDGKSTCFWADRWLHGQTIHDLAPTLFALVAKQIAKIRTVHEALQDLRWVGDIGSTLSAQALLEFLILWDIL
jgi:hypothetical protein